MRAKHLHYLRCISCEGYLDFKQIVEQINGQIKSGTLVCRECRHEYQIVKFIPRFVLDDNYADNFGFQWHKHRRTQYDSYNGGNHSEQRFFEETQWERDLSGQLILEVGCGAGRFTEQALKTGAMIISFDLSSAVEVNYEAHGHYENVLIVQANIYHLPFPKNYFDKVFCMGVIQHTPNPERTFKTLPEYLKTGGQLAIDVYRVKIGILGTIRQILKTYRWFRWYTKRMPEEELYRWVENYINLVWRPSALISKIPVLGTRINRILLIADYRGLYENITDDDFKQWAILDTFDNLSPAYDQPQKLSTVMQWFEEAPLKDVEVHYGWNGIEGRASKR